MPPADYNAAPSTFQQVIRESRVGISADIVPATQVCRVSLLYVSLFYCIKTYEVPEQCTILLSVFCPVEMYPSVR